MSCNDFTDVERQFLIEHGGLTAADLAPEALAETNAAVDRAVAAAADQVRTRALTLSEVATLLDWSHARVLRALAAGEMYSVPSEPPSVEPMFPRWQFRDGSVVPHLREVLAVLPIDEHPLNVEHFMTQPNVDYLDGTPPLIWLVEGRKLDPILRYADDLSWI